MWSEEPRSIAVGGRRIVDRAAPWRLPFPRAAGEGQWDTEPISAHTGVRAVCAFSSRPGAVSWKCSAFPRHRRGRANATVWSRQWSDSRHVASRKQRSHFWDATPGLTHGDRVVSARWGARRGETLPSLDRSAGLAHTHATEAQGLRRCPLETPRGTGMASRDSPWGFTAWIASARVAASRTQPNPLASTTPIPAQANGSRRALREARIRPPRLKAPPAPEPVAVPPAHDPKPEVAPPASAGAAAPPAMARLFASAKLGAAPGVWPDRSHTRDAKPGSPMSPLRL